MSKNIVAASILSADLCSLGEDIDRAQRAGADYLHFDVMDGGFVNNISYGIPVLDSVRKYTDMFLDVHLMITEPVRYVARFAEYGADMITFHLEAARDVRKTIDEIKKTGRKAGIALKPATPFSEVIPYFADIDMLLISNRIKILHVSLSQVFLIMVSNNKMNMSVKSLKDRVPYI